MISIYLKIPYITIVTPAAQSSIFSDGNPLKCFRVIRHFSPFDWLALVFTNTNSPSTLVNDGTKNVVEPLAGKSPRAGFGWRHSHSHGRRRMPTYRNRWPFTRFRGRAGAGSWIIRVFFSAILRGPRREIAATDESEKKTITFFQWKKTSRKRRRRRREENNNKKYVTPLLLRRSRPTALCAQRPSPRMNFTGRRARYRRDKRTRTGFPHTRQPPESYDTRVIKLYQ